MTSLSDVFSCLHNKLLQISYDVGLLSGQPKPVKASWKYSTKGIFNAEAFENLNIDETQAEMLASLANLGLAESTHKVYQTVINHIKRCAIEKNVNLDLPFDTQKTLTFVSYLLFDRKVKAKTCDKYLSGVRMYHLSKGHNVPVLRPAIISLILRGKEHWEDIKDKMSAKKQRIPVTITVMKLLKRRIRKINWTKSKKLLVWAVCCLAWNGSFRIHEILSKSKHEYDPLVTLLDKDVRQNSYDIKGQFKCRPLLINLNDHL